MKELCEPCEWAGATVPADHFVGWDQMPLCEYHYEIDKQGRLGNWVNEHVVFDAPEDTPTEPQEVLTLTRSAEPTANYVLRYLEDSAWQHLRGPGASELKTYFIVDYVITILRDFGYDVSDLEITLEQVME